MSGLTAFMIGWGVFWLLIWGSLTMLFVLPPRVRNDAENVGICGCMSLISVFWIAAWLLVRVIA